MTTSFTKKLEPFPDPFYHLRVSQTGHKMIKGSSSEITFLLTSVKDHVCECTLLRSGLLKTRRTYFPQVGGARLSISSTSPALADDGFTEGGQPSWRSRPPPVRRHSWDLLWGSWDVRNSWKHTWVKKRLATVSECKALGIFYWGIVTNLSNEPYLICLFPPAVSNRAGPSAKSFSWKCVWIERKVIS